jgi:hypothetical protein
MPVSPKTDPLAAHWRTLTLQPGAPQCVIKEAHRFHIRRVHPDLGGSEAEAKRVNIAMDKLDGRGAAANDYVSRHYDREPWLLLGLTATADKALADRAGKALAEELTPLPRLVSRVEWAAANFGKPAPNMPQPRRREPKAPPPPPAKPWMPSIRPAPPIGRPDGLERVEFGAIDWGADAESVIRLTWPRRAPVNVRAEAGAPFTADVTVSKTQPGRVAIKLGVDWDSPAAAAAASRDSVRFDSTLTVRWDAEGVATTRITATAERPCRIAVGPREIDLGHVRLRQPVQTELTVRSSRSAQVTVETSAWLAPRMKGPVRLEANAPVILAFSVVWPPILERGATAIKAGRPVRPTGNIRLKWDGGDIVVPLTMSVSTSERSA